MKVKTLYVGYPVSQLGKAISFGGVLTKVGKPELGILKLLEFPVINGKLVVTEIASDDESAKKHYATIMACRFDCIGEDNIGRPYVSIPLVGMSEDNEYVILDLSSLTLRPQSYIRNGSRREKL